MGAAGRRAGARRAARPSGEGACDQRHDRAGLLRAALDRRLRQPHGDGDGRRGARRLEWRHDLPALAALVVPGQSRSDRARRLRGDQGRLPHASGLDPEHRSSPGRPARRARDAARGAPWPQGSRRDAAAGAADGDSLRLRHVGHALLPAPLHLRPDHVGEPRAPAPAGPVAGGQRRRVARLRGRARARVGGRPVRRLPAVRGAHPAGAGTRRAAPQLRLRRPAAGRRRPRVQRAASTPISDCVPRANATCCRRRDGLAPRDRCCGACSWWRWRWRRCGAGRGTRGSTYDGLESGHELQRAPYTATSRPSWAPRPPTVLAQSCGRLSRCPEASPEAAAY